MNTIRHTVYVCSTSDDKSGKTQVADFLKQQLHLSLNRTLSKGHFVRTWASAEVTEPWEEEKTENTVLMLSLQDSERKTIKF